MKAFKSIAFFAVILLVGAWTVYSNTAVVGSMWKQVGSIVSPADDVDSVVLTAPIIVNDKATPVGEVLGLYNFNNTTSYFSVDPTADEFISAGTSAHARFILRTVNNTTAASSQFSARTYDNRITLLANNAQRSGTRYGQAFAGWVEVLGYDNDVEGLLQGVAFGSLEEVPIIIGNNDLNRLTISANGRAGFNDVFTPLAQVHIDQSVTDEAIPVITLDQADISEEFIFYNTSSDQDMVLEKLSVTGNPTKGWDEGDDSFNFSHGIKAEKATTISIQSITTNNATNAAAQLITETPDNYMYLMGNNSHRPFSRYGQAFAGWVEVLATDNVASGLKGLAFGSNADIPIILGNNDLNRLTIAANGRSGFNDVFTPLGQVHIDQASTTEAIPVLVLDQGDTDGSFINFVGASAGDATKSISTLTTSGATTHHFRVELGGVQGWMSFSTNDPS